MIWYIVWYDVWYYIWYDMIWCMIWYGVIYDMVCDTICKGKRRVINENHVRTLRLIYYWRFPIFELSSPKVYLHRVFYGGDAVWESVQLICFEFRFWKRYWAMYGFGCCNILVYVLSMHFLKYMFSKKSILFRGMLGVIKKKTSEAAGTVAGTVFGHVYWFGAIIVLVWRRTSNIYIYIYI